jgi:pyruvate formate lyase activating enzyme
LVRAAEIGYDEGLHFVYAGNDPGHVKSYENTYCPNCKTTLIERFGYLIRDYKITDDGCCPKCNAKIPGIWPKSKDEVNIRNNFFMRMPRSAF